MRLGEMELAAAAKAVAGNWLSFSCFSWYRKPVLSDARNWALIYTSHRDSGLVDQSNAAVIEETLKPFSEDDDPDVVFEWHNHFAVGYCDGFSVRVYRRGRITKAFRQYHDVARRMALYPVLDDTDLGNREYEATLANIKNAAHDIADEYELPEHWESAVYRWLDSNIPEAVESTDDQGGWPETNELWAAFDALGYQGQLV